jgi:acetylornithine deacetylase/succinyl-diaminopimelate desuccinylase-like protein
LPVALTFLAPAAPAQEPVSVAREFREAHGPRILREFAELLAIPNVSDDLPNLRKNAEWIRHALEARGAEVEFLELDGVAPAVLGRLETPGATRTLGIYVHYDGQPVEPAAWTYPPFAPTLCTAALESGGAPRPLPADGEAIDPEWRLYARGAADDRAPIAAIAAALDALEERGVPRTSNLLFLLEGEEEAGSPHLGAVFAAHREKLAADAWLICDGPVHQTRRPQLAFGVRGITGCDITVYGANRALHSGHYGNFAPDPSFALARLLATMRTDEGYVRIAGFYDGIAPLEDRVRDAAETIPHFETDLLAELGLAAAESDTYLDALLTPTLNVRGLASGAVGAAASNVIPPSATASLDIRLVEGNDPVRMLDLVEAHVRDHGWFVVSAEPTAAERRTHPQIARIERRGGYRAVRTSLDDPIVMRLFEAVKRAAGEPPVMLPTLGGSLPLHVFEDVLGDVPLAIVPIANHDDNQHAPDENLRIANLWYGIDLMAALFTM